MTSRAHTPISWAALTTASVLVLTNTPAVEAQEYGFDLRFDRARITPRHEASFQVWAWFTPSPAWSVLRIAAFDLVASEPSSGFGRWDCSPPPCMACPFHPPPTHGPGRLSGIGAIQSIIDPCPDNPIWTGGTTWGSFDFTPREVEIWTECDGFAVYDTAWEVTNLTETHPHGFRDGRTTVYITDCEADMDWDGQLTFFDFLEFFNLYAAGAMDADCNGDETLNFEDFLCFQNDFARGCP